MAGNAARSGRLICLLLAGSVGGCVLQWHQARPAVKGRVVDAGTGVPIGTARVSLPKGYADGDMKATKVNDDGRFRRGAGSHLYFTFGYPNWGPPAPRQMVVEAPGYQPAVREMHWWRLQRGWSFDGAIELEKDDAAASMALQEVDR